MAHISSVGVSLTFFACVLLSAGVFSMENAVEYTEQGVHRDRRATPSISVVSLFRSSFPSFHIHNEREREGRRI
jgi:hypothetical protein